MVAYMASPAMSLEALRRGPLTAVSSLGLAITVLAVGCAAPKPRTAAQAAAVPLTLLWAIRPCRTNRSSRPTRNGAGARCCRWISAPRLGVSNRARNGSGSKSLFAEGRWKAVLEQMRPGDNVIIQFGHNDQSTTDPLRFTAPFGELKQNLKRHVHEARRQRAVPSWPRRLVR